MNLNYHKMKFLRLAFYVLIAQLVLSGCAGEGVEETSSSSSSEINFDAYVGRNASSRAGINDIDSLKSNRWNSGFGVFARYNRYNHTVEGIKSPMLMDDEHVYWKNWKGNLDWGYDHIRFWPSEGSVDFYAFAPCVPGIVLENKPGSNEANPTYIRFTSNMSPIDLLWANQTGQIAPTSPDSKVKFRFKHATARFGFDITAPELLKNGADITVDNVKLYCVSNNVNIGVFDMVGYLNLDDTGDWHVINDEKTRWYYSWTPHGRDGENPDGYKEGQGPELKITGEKLDKTNDIITNSPNSFIFIIPQEIPHPDKNDPYKKAKEDFYLEITYTVKQGKYEEEVTVRKNLLDVLRPGVPNPSFKFEEGKSYVFHLILSLDPINFSITPKVEDWK